MFTSSPTKTQLSSLSQQHQLKQTSFASSWLEISASAFNNNATSYKRAIGTSLLAPVIKANAYGHGIIEIGQLCEKNSNIDWICVVKLSEALLLRNNGVTKPILILGFLDEDPLKAINLSIEYACSDYQQACVLNAIGKQTNTLISIHLKVDTGLSRFGRYPAETVTLINLLGKLSFIRITGIWSHCAESHKEDQAFTFTQIDRFKNLVKTLSNNGTHIPFTHMGNSAASTAYDLSFCNFFRIGLGMYGYWPSESIKKTTQQLFPDFSLQPIATWKTRILYIKQVPAGTDIGYDRTAHAQHDTTIALLPVGYEDGYSPFLANKGIVGIGNEYAPVIGRIAMNVTTIDITHILHAFVGQEVTLLGNDPLIDASTLAHAIQIYNPRFITTSIKNSLPRIIKD